MRDCRSKHLETPVYRVTESLIERDTMKGRETDRT